MALIEIGSVADEAAVDAPGRRDTVVPQRSDTSDHLLDAVRRGLAPGDPVARLLAGWPPVPAQAVGTVRARPGVAQEAPAMG